MSRLDDALSIMARAEATVRVNRRLSGGDTAAEIKGENINLTIGKDAVVSGTTDAVVMSAVGPYVPPVDDGGIGPFAQSPGIATLDNAGTITGGSGSAIRVTDGTAIIRNTGRIEGRVTLADGDDRVANAGVMLVSANSDFGAGDDLFTNTGVVQFAKAAAPITAGFLNLERFVNDGGLIDLRNERAGDVFSLAGAYVGSGQARLALDVSGGTADRLTIAGAATGSTTVLLQGLKPSEATLTAKPATLIAVGAGSAADAFKLGNADQGLIRYGLSFNATTRTFELDSSAGLSVHRVVRAGEALDGAWRASADAFNAEQMAERALGGEPGGVWAQLHGASTSRDGDSDAFALNYDQDVVGGQMGVTLGGIDLLGGQAGFGLTAGYVDTSLTFADGGPDAEVQTLNVGAYGAWRRENLFATGLLKVDSHQFSFHDRQAGYEADLDGLSWGAQFQAGYRLDVVGLTVEPSVTVDYVATSLDDLEALGQRVEFDDQSGLSTRLGAQAFKEVNLSEGRSLVLSAGLEGVHAFDPDRSGVLVSGGQSDAVASQGAETYGRALAGVQVELSEGLQASLQAEGRFGEGQSGGGVRLGVRYRF